MSSHLIARTILHWPQARNGACVTFAAGCYHPDGRRDFCYTGGSDITGDMRYVTTDGAYAHVTIHRGTEQYWGQRRWTIHFNDGRRVEGRRDQTERIVDRNGNTITVERRTDCAYGEGTKLQENRPCTFLREDLGREIKIFQLEDGDEIVTAPGYDKDLAAEERGGELEWEIERGTVDMSGGTYSCVGDESLSVQSHGFMPCSRGHQGASQVVAGRRGRAE